MKKGLVLGKFLPLHKGHVALIQFAISQCDKLCVLVCVGDSESIDGEVRLHWLLETFNEFMDKLKIKLVYYNERDLPNTSVSSIDVSKKWAELIQKKFDVPDVIFSSEKYGDYLAGFLNCKHVLFDQERKEFTISGTQIRNRPLQFWEFLPDIVKPYYLKKICICGTESTGKSTLTEHLARHFNTDFVPEMAREIIEKTDECTETHLEQIAELHAESIIKKSRTANKLLFVDTDVTITQSYSKFLFQKELNVPFWIIEANRCDLYLYLENDVDYIQDGTRLSKERRDQLDNFHIAEYKGRKIVLSNIKGNWKEKEELAIRIVSERFLLNNE